MISQTTYLNRIGIDAAKPPTLAFLAELQLAHLYHVPFENLDVRRGVPIVLTYEALFDKVVTRNRGGFCFECNGLFGWLLRDLGFDVTRITASVFNGERYGIQFDHMALLVHFAEGTYWTDVGFGDAARQPILMPNGTAQDISGRYRIVPPTTDDYFHFQQDKGNGWVNQYRFTTTPYTLADFEGGCHYHQTSPHTTFTQRTVCTLATPEGRITFSDEVLTITRGADKERVDVTSAEQQASLLAERFGVILR